MSKLNSVNPCMTALTLCPGNVLYMSPEALDEAKTYTAKLDVFSFGVIAIQILTRQFPNPTDRFRLVYSSEFNEEIRRVVPETKRRDVHIKLILDTHSLKPLALQCLKKKESERPSALQLSETLSELKHSWESMHLTQSSSDIQQLQQQIQGQTEAKTREVQEHHAQITVLETMVEDKNRNLQANQHTIEMKKRELQQAQTQLRASEQLVSEFQQSVEQKDKTITDLQHTISAYERNFPQLEHQNAACRHQPQQQPVTTPHTTVAAAQRDSCEKTWKEGKNAPEKLRRGAAVVHGNTAYFTLCDSYKIYGYQNIRDQEHWYQLPENTNQNFGLAVVDGFLTSVGGGCFMLKVYTTALLSLTGEGDKKWWSVIFPPMITPRASASCVTTDQALVVAGGTTLHACSVATVEVMNINTKMWTIVSPLPQRQSAMSSIVCGETLYLAGGYTDIVFKPMKSVFACPLPALLNPSNSRGSRIRRTLHQSAWREISSLPVRGSTLASFNGDLLAIGGRDHDSWNPTADVYRYDSCTDTWNVISQMKINRSWCLGVTIPEDQLVVVGGYTQGIDATNSVEIF